MSLAGGCQTIIPGVDDHRNLEYISSTRRLSSRHGHWAFIFFHFHFLLSYHQGSMYIEPDSLSQQFQGENLAESLDTIPPPPFVVATLTWDFEERF